MFQRWGFKMENKCVWEYVNLVDGLSHYTVECGKEDKLKYYSGYTDYHYNGSDYYRFEYCPFCGKEIERK